MNGEPLPIEHGFPVRMVVPGLYGYVSATKWVTELEVTRFDEATAYWTDARLVGARSGQAAVAHRRAAPGPADRRGRRGHRRHGLAAARRRRRRRGAHRRGGLACVPSSRPPISTDTWVQWRLPWTAESGSHTIECRALSADGETQTVGAGGVVPDGAQGWHRIEVRWRERPYPTA